MQKEKVYASYYLLETLYHCYLIRLIASPFASSNVIFASHFVIVILLISLCCATLVFCQVNHMFSSSCRVKNTKNVNVF